MEFRAEIKVSAFDRNHPRFNEETTYRELAFLMVKDMPLEVVKQLFNMRKMNPETPEEPVRYRAEILIEEKLK